MHSKLQKSVARRANFCCEYCKALAAYSPAAFVVEHILPLSRGGATVLLNLAFACQGCNNFKYAFTTAIDPATGLEVPLFNPRTDSWSEHFCWNENFTLVFGQTAIGRATVERLKMNRPELMNIRRVLFLIGEHPPA